MQRSEEKKKNKFITHQLQSLEEKWKAAFQCVDNEVLTKQKNKTHNLKEQKNVALHTKYN